LDQGDWEKDLEPAEASATGGGTAIQARAQELLQERLILTSRNTDRRLALLAVAEWIVCVAVAFWVARDP